MTPKPNSTHGKLAIHPRRNLPDSLLRKRCEERFAQVLEEYAEEERHQVEWALIFESGRENKMLLVSVYGWYDVFPMRLQGDGESDDERDSEERAAEREGKGEGCGGDELKEGISEGAKGPDEMRNDDEKLKRHYDMEINGGDDKKTKSKKGKKSKGEHGKELSKEEVKKMVQAMTVLKGREEDQAIFVAEQTSSIASGLLEEDNQELSDKTASSINYNPWALPDTPSTAQKKRKEKTIDKETYTVIGTIMNSEVEWLCDDPQYEGYEDKTTYFNKDGLSMVHGVRIHDRITERKRAALAQLKKMREEEEEIILCEKQAKREAKKTRQKAGLMLELSDDDKGDAGDRKRAKTKAKRSRQKQRQNAQLKDATLDTATALWYKHNTGEDLDGKDVESKITVVDPSTPEGAAAVARAEQLGFKMFSATQLDGMGS